MQNKPPEPEFKTSTFLIAFAIAIGITIGGVAIEHFGITEKISWPILIAIAVGALISYGMHIERKKRDETQEQILAELKKQNRKQNDQRH